MTTKNNRETPRRSPIDRAMAGWQPARVLMAANHLDFFTALGNEALSAEEVASRCQCHPRSTRMLLNACVALSILEKEGNLYRNSAEARDALVRGKPNYMGDTIAHQENVWQTWGKLHEAVRTNRRVVRRTPVRPAEEQRNFIMAMHNWAMREANVLAETLDLSGRRQLFDAGGGPGTYCIFLVKRYPGLRAIVFDLPQTIEITKEVIASFGVADRITTRAGDYFKDDFGQGNDVVLISAVLHGMGPEKAKGLLRKAYNSLVPGGLMVVQERLVNEDGVSPVQTVLFSLNMLLSSGEGQSYTATEISGLMEAVGFTQPGTISLPRQFGTTLITAVKP